MVCVEGEMVKVEKPQPIFSCDAGMAAYCIILVCNPHDQDDIKCSSRVFEKLGHDSFHSYSKSTDVTNTKIGNTFFSV